jgi:hypothetical protein
METEMKRTYAEDITVVKSANARKRNRKMGDKAMVRETAIKPIIKANKSRGFIVAHPDDDDTVINLKSIRKLSDIPTTTD